MRRCFSETSRITGTGLAARNRCARFPAPVRIAGAARASLHTASAGQGRRCVTGSLDGEHGLSMRDLRQRAVPPTRSERCWLRPASAKATARLAVAR
jgi:hypothetical protein